MPPYNSQRPPERPRPFQPASTQQPATFSNNPSQNEINSYPDYGGQPGSTSGLTTGGPGSSTGYSPSSPSLGSSSAAGSSSLSFGGSPSTSTTYLPPTQSPAAIGPGYPYPSPGSRPTPGFPTPTRPTLAPGSTPGRPSNYFSLIWIVK